MARTDTFQNWATDVADSIRAKTGKTGKIPMANFDTEIASIEGGGGSGKYAPRYVSFTSYTGSELVQELNNLDTSNMTNMSKMFYMCSGLLSLDLKNFNTSNVNNTTSMFGGCSKLTSLDVSNFDTSNVTDMRYMFSGCQSLTSIDLTGWDTSNVTNMNYMFENCSKLQKIDGFIDWSKISSYPKVLSPRISFETTPVNSPLKTCASPNLSIKVITQTETHFLSFPSRFFIRFKMYSFLSLGVELSPKNL
jgi:surface protein